MTSEPLTGTTLTVRCACGWETSGAEADVVATTIDHGRRLHNMEATREQVLSMAAPRVEDTGEAGDSIAGAG